MQKEMGYVRVAILKSDDYRSIVVLFIDVI
jgi:hypothetical protein